MRPASVRALLLALPIVVVACGGGGKDQADSRQLTAQEVLSRSAARFESVKTFHFKLEHENGSTQIPLNLRLVEAEGDVIMPDRLRAEVEAKAAATTVRVNVIGIGDRTWITNPFTRQFQRIPGDASISDVVDPAGIVAAVSRNLTNSEIAGADRVDGVDAYRITGNISSDALLDALTFADPGRTLSVEVWIGKGDLLLRRARLKGPLRPDEANNIVRQISLSRFDAPVTIEPPE